MGSPSHGESLTGLGGVLIIVGVCASYVLEMTATDAAESTLFQAVRLTYFPTVLLGLLLIGIGSCFLVAQLAPIRCLQIGLGLLMMAGATALLSRSGIMAINVHDWTGALLPPLLSLLPLSLLFLVLGMVRGGRSRKSRKGA